MDDMNEIERKMQEDKMLANTIQNDGELANVAPVSIALENTAATIVEKAQEKINSERLVDKHAKALAKNADERIANEIERQNVINERTKATNTTERKAIANELYRIKQEGIRLKKEQIHLSKMQKAQQKAEKSHAYWEAHKNTLEQYKMHEGSNKFACDILLWLDGVKCFFNGLSKVSDALIKALKYVLIFGGAFAVLMAIPVTREWLLGLLGFIKK